MEILDAGRAYDGGRPPATIRFGERRAAELPHGRAAAVDARRGAEGLVSRPAARARARPGRSGATRRARSTGAPIRRTCRPGSDEALARAGYAGIGGGDYSAAYTERARDLRLRRATRGSPASRPSRATATASGPGSRPRRCRRGLRAGRRRVHHRLDLGARPGRGRSSIACRRTIRCGRSTSWTGPAARSRSPRSTCCCVHGVRSCLEYAAERRPRARRGRVRTRTSRRICRSSTWAATATRRCGSTRDAIESEFVCIPRPIERSARRGRRAAPLSRRPPRAALAAGRAAGARAAGAGGRRGVGRSLGSVLAAPPRSSATLARLSQGRAVRRSRSGRYCTAFIMSKIGRYMAMTMPPTITPRSTIIAGSIRLTSALTATSTSSS